jgi:uncharacterized membrane protein (DUF373 family)
MTTARPPAPTEPFVDDRTRRTITRVFRLFEDVIFVGLGLMLASCALYLLAAAAGRFAEHVFRLTLNGAAVVDLIEQLLLILLVVEILYTVQVSFREHALAPEPFLLIGLIAAVRRVLVITAELAESRNNSEQVFRFLMIELGVLTGLILALVASVVMLRRKSGPAEVRRHE